MDYKINYPIMDQDISFEEACRLISEHRLAVASSGNLSVLNQNNTINITPSGHWFEYPIDLSHTAKIDLDGNALRGNPSVESKMHATIYRNDASKKIKAVLHFQSPNATAICCCHLIPTFKDKTIYEKHYYIKNIEYVKSHFPGSDELAVAVGDCFLKNPETTTVFMANHGIITAGESLKDVVQKALFIELISDIWIKRNLL